MELTKEQVREVIARRVAKEFKGGEAITLGIGLPTEVANYIPDSMHVLLQSENGIIGVGPRADETNRDNRISNAGGVLVTIKEGGAYFDSFLSFSMIRGGHIDATVLGALQVDEKGNRANWVIPGKLVPGMGGAMDLLVGAKKVILTMEHTAKGNHKILKKCRLPLTAAGQVNMIITEMGVMEITPNGIVLTEINPEFTVEQVQEATEAKLIISENLKQVNLN